MPTYVTSANTWEELKAEYKDCASYDVAGDTDLCKRFIVASRLLLADLQTRFKQGEVEGEMDPSQIGNALKKAEGWLASNDSTATTVTRGRVRGIGIAGYR